MEGIKAAAIVLQNVSGHNCGANGDGAGSAHQNGLVRRTHKFIEPHQHGLRLFTHKFLEVHQHGLRRGTHIYVLNRTTDFAAAQKKFSTLTNMCSAECLEPHQDLLIRRTNKFF